MLSPHHKLPLGTARSGVDMGDIHAGGEVVDVEGVAHVVHGENGEELALHDNVIMLSVINVF